MLFNLNWNLIYSQEMAQHSLHTRNLFVAFGSLLNIALQFIYIILYQSTYYHSTDIFKGKDGNLAALFIKFMQLSGYFLSHHR